MADPFSITTFALAATYKLVTTIRDYKGHDKKARALKNEVQELVVVLQTLLDTMGEYPDVAFSSLAIPLEQCGKTCEEYQKLILRVTAHSTDSSRPSVRDWVKAKYLGGDIDNFKEMLAGYKATINIALANVHIRIAKSTPGALEEYKDLMTDTKEDLKEHLHRLEIQIKEMSQTTSVQTNDELQTLLEEKQSTQQGLKICAELSDQIERLEPEPEAGPEPGQAIDEAQHPSARRYVRSGLDVTKGSIHAIVTNLRSHEDGLDQRIQNLRGAGSTSLAVRDVDSELKQLQETKESIQQCIQFISEADKSLAAERQNLFEDITLSDDAYNFTVSTVGDLVTARRIDLKDRSRNVAGQISDESFQKAIDVFSRDDLKISRQLDLDEIPRAASRPSKAKGSTEEFDSRYGRGHPLAKTGGKSRS